MWQLYWAWLILGFSSKNLNTAWLDLQLQMSNGFATGLRTELNTLDSILTPLQPFSTVRCTKPAELPTWNSECVGKMDLFSFLLCYPRAWRGITNVAPGKSSTSNAKIATQMPASLLKPMLSALNRWYSSTNITGHCTLMPDFWFLKQVLYTQFSHSPRSCSSQRKCYKDTLKIYLERMNANIKIRGKLTANWF